MAKKKNYWYVLVLTSEGAKFVTKINYSDKTAEWDGVAKPLEMDMSRAKDLAFGLMCNFHQAYPVCSPIELDAQPYYYSKGHFEWKWTEDDKESEK